MNVHGHAIIHVTNPNCKILMELAPVGMTVVNSLLVCSAKLIMVYLHQRLFLLFSYAGY